MKAHEWIDRVKSVRGWDSDYRVAKELGLTRSAVSNYRTQGTTLNDDTASRVADALGERSEAIIIDQMAERAQLPAVRAALSDAARRLCVLC